MKKHLAFILVCSAAVAASADPTITITRVQQRYPWNGLVDIDYTISGQTGLWEDYYARFKVTAGQTVYYPSNFLTYAFCDLPVTNGTHRVTWDTAADGVAFRAKNAQFDLDLVYEPVVDTEASYMVVDLSGGVEATTWPVKYVKGDFPSAQFNKDLYKTQKFVLKKVKAGSFWMGTGSNGNVSSGNNRHYVTLSKDFFLGIFPFTQGQYKQAYGAAHWWVSGYDKYLGSRYPVSDISYNMIHAAYKLPGNNVPTRECVISNLASKARFHGEALPAAFKLPTESQREYACRAGTLTSYPWGADQGLLADYAWYNLNAGANILNEVGLKLPNPWGFYDIISLVSEWTTDWDGTYPTGTEENPNVDPTGPATGAKKILRGGHCTSSAANCYSGTRISFAPTADRDGSAHYYFGFRLSLTLPNE